MAIKTLSQNSCEGIIDLPISLKNGWLAGKRIRICPKLTITAYLDNVSPPQTDEVVAVNKQILDVELGTDVQIICADGTRLNCNSGFLIGNSSLNKYMFSNYLIWKYLQDVLLN